MGVLWRREPTASCWSFGGCTPAFISGNSGRTRRKLKLAHGEAYGEQEKAATQWATAFLRDGNSRLWTSDRNQDSAWNRFRCSRVVIRGHNQEIRGRRERQDR